MSSKKHSLEASSDRLGDTKFLQRALRELRLGYWLMRQRDVPILTKLLPIAVALYVVSPVDFIPDWLLGLGQLDDIALAMLGVRLFLHLAPPEVVGRYEADRAAELVAVDSLPDALEESAPDRSSLDA